MKNYFRMEPTITLQSFDSDFIDAVAAHYSCHGFRFKSKTAKRVWYWKLFGKKEYTITLVANKTYYEAALKGALANEDYEMAAELQRKINQTTNEN